MIEVCQKMNYSEHAAGDMMHFDKPQICRVLRFSIFIDQIYIQIS